ncbi:unnamed protein product [Caenorhabditis auriculariae]|uniref:Uncharacterized protein n=1 Tax=Caenorhabditis auriculariae TaxID=2777116 RepID=A0A8S1HMW6_9PELO|nr:unnamed protein product [Caenorhabditis auriculariae]
MVSILTVHKTTTHYTTPPVASRRLRVRPYTRWKTFDEFPRSPVGPIHPQSLNSQLVVERRPCPTLEKEEKRGKKKLGASSFSPTRTHTRHSRAGVTFLEVLPTSD